jgi:TolB-like protein/tetratricopeptide (TPR) repeat protein
MSLFSELKRRNVFKVAGAYLVVAWVVIQVADVVAPQLSLPEWAPRFVTLLVLLGFPLALVLAWIFDITPEGIRADASSGNKRVFAVGTVVAVAILGWYLPRLTRGPRAAEARSIAVLPFVNMSGDPEQEYFSDGISEEILNVLARTPELRVAARTSSFAFKGQNLELPDIARALQVGMVLEGSVRQQDRRVRITAQLIDAETGFHIWSETYDRDLKDIFAVQDEIAGAIGQELKIRVGGERGSGTDASATVNPEAYDLYLKGLALWRARSVQGLLDAAEDFNRAIEIDPDFAKAYAGLAMTYGVLPDYTPQISYDSAYALSQDAGERALALDPTLPEAFAGLGNVAVASGRKATGVALLQRAIAFSPSFATAYQWLGTALVPAGRLNEGLAALERAHELDPQSVIVADNYANMLLVAERYSDAIDVCRAVLETDSGTWLCRSADFLARLHQSGAEGARSALMSWATRAGSDAERQAEEVLAALEGHGDAEAIAQRIVRLPQRTTTDPEAGVLFQVTEAPSVLVRLGALELAYEYLERAIDVGYGFPDWGMIVPGVDPLRCETRFRALVARIGMVDPRFERVCGGGNGP